METYRWVSGARFKGDVLAAGQALKQLRAQTVEDIVQAARAVRSPLHLLIFDKPEAEAAHSYYCDRARALVRSIEIIPSINAEEDEGNRAFYLVSPEADELDEVDEIANIVVTDKEVLANPIWRRQVVSRLEATLRGAAKDLKRMQSPLAKPVAQLHRRTARVLEKMAV